MPSAEDLEILQQSAGVGGQIVPAGALHDTGKRLARLPLGPSQLLVGAQFQTDRLDSHTQIMHESLVRRQALRQNWIDCPLAAQPLGCRVETTLLEPSGLR